MSNTITFLFVCHCLVLTSSLKIQRDIDIDKQFPGINSQGIYAPPVQNVQPNVMQPHVVHPADYKDSASIGDILSSLANPNKWQDQMPNTWVNEQNQIHKADNQVSVADLFNDWQQYQNIVKKQQALDAQQKRVDGQVIGAQQGIAAQQIQKAMNSMFGR